MSMDPRLDAALRAVFRELGMGGGGSSSMFKKDLNPREELKWDCLPDDFVSALRLNGYDIVARK